MALAVGAFAAVELGLRFVPSAIPAVLLEHFPYDLRQRIDVGQTLFQQNRLIDVPRDDGGPTLYVPAPDTVFRRPQHPSDRTFGAVEAITTDDTGFCNPPTRRWSIEDAEIVALGDSFTWCVSVAPEHAWPAQLEALTERPTYNLGRGGIGLYEALQILKVYGLTRDPEIVILNVYEGNDVEDAFRYWSARRSAGADAERPPLLSAEGLAEVGREAAADPWWKRLARGTVETAMKDTPLGRSYVAHLALAAYRAAVSRRPTDGRDFRYDVLVNGHIVEFNTANHTRDLIYAQAVSGGDVPPSLLDSALASFAEISRKAGFRAMVVYTPAVYTAYERLTTFKGGGVADLMRRFSRTQREWLSDAARRHGLEYVDLTPVLQEAAAASREPLYFPGNQHLTAAGHGVVAAALAEVLRRTDSDGAVASACEMGHDAARKGSQAVAVSQPFQPAHMERSWSAGGRGPAPCSRPSGAADTAP